MEKAINQRIANTGIFVFGYDSESKLYRYSRQFAPEEAEALAKATNRVIEAQYKGARGLRQGLTAIKGDLVNMSTLKGIVANNVLMNNSQDERWLSTIAEGLALHKSGMFAPNDLIDFGLALYDGENPDKEIAQAMMKVANDRKYKTPILASFTSLGLVNGGERYKVTPQLTSSNGLITGQEAVKVLEEDFAYKGNSGVRGVDRGRNGGWDAYWYVDLDYFDVGCRVGRFSAKGSAKKLREEELGAFAPIQQSLDSIVKFAEVK